MIIGLSSKRRCCAAVALFSAVCASPVAWGTSKTWNGGVGNWDNPQAWTPGQIPQALDNAYITTPGSMVTYQNPSTPTGLVNLLQVSATGAGAMITMAGGQLTSGDTEIGDDATGTFTQSGGTHTVLAANGFYLGRTNTGVGTYNLSGTGVLNVDDSVYVGLHGAAVFNQSGGTVTLGGSGGQGLLTLANGAGSALYHMTGGTLNGKLLIVDTGTSGGLFKQSAGTATFSEGINIEGSFGSTSSYELSGTGSLTDTYCLIGFSTGASTFKQSGGTHTVTNNLSIGNGQAGDYLLSGGILNTGQTLVGANAKGKFEQSGGTHTVTGSLSIGSSMGSIDQDLFSLSAGSVTSGGLMIFGTGFFNQSGGTTVTTTLTMFGTSHLKLSGGTLKVVSVQLDPGKSKIDLTDRAMLIDYNGSSPLLAVRASAKSGYNGGTWTGAGFASSTAAANPSSRAVGYGEAKDVLGLSGNATASWNGYTVDATSILVRGTVNGDANLDGKVNFVDLVAVAQHYGISNGSALWTQGDFDYDGNVGFSDLVKVAQNYGGALPSAVPDFGADFAGDMARAFSSVPEPGMAGVAAVMLIAGSGLRRRRRA